MLQSMIGGKKYNTESLKHHVCIGEIFRKLPDRPWGPPITLYNGYRVSFQGANLPERCVDHRPASSVEVKEIVKLHLYFPLGLSGLF